MFHEDIYAQESLIFPELHAQIQPKWGDSHNFREYNIYIPNILFQSEGRRRRKKKEREKEGEEEKKGREMRRRETERERREEEERYSFCVGDD